MRKPKEKDPTCFRSVKRLTVPSLLTKRKLDEIFFALLIFLLPVQLGRHFWPEWSRVLGLRIDYLSPTIYLTDLLGLGILGSWLSVKLKKSKRRSAKGKRLRYLRGRFLPAALIVLFFLVINVFTASNQPAAFFKLIKLIELTLLGFYVYKKGRWSIVNNFLPLAVFYASFLAVFQFFKQSSLGGVFWWLGERTFNIATPGIAKIDFGGQLFLRPYSVFSHPNSLAGFLLIALVLFNDELNRPKPSKKKNKIIPYLVMFLAVAALALSFSRSVWVAGVLAGVFLNFVYLKKKKTPLATWGLAGLGWLGILTILFFFLTKTNFTEPLDQRFFLNQAALAMIKDSFWRGVGLNNFLVRLPEYWLTGGLVHLIQPVHNLFLLVAAETGILGLLAFSGLLGTTLKRIVKLGRWKLGVALAAVIVLGMVDHYWLTLQQNQLLLAIVFGLAWKDE